MNQNENINQDKNQDKNQVQQALDALIQAVKTSREYIQYQEVREKVHAYPELETQLHAYRKRNYEFQNHAESRDLYEKAEQLDRSGMEFRRKPLVSEYLAAELALCRMFQNINWSIVQSIDFDIGFTI